MSPYLPITPEEIAGQAVEAARAGAAAVHIHARNPQNGMPSPDLNLFREIVDRIRSETDVIICITTGGGTGMTVDQWAAPVPEFKPNWHPSIWAPSTSPSFRSSKSMTSGSTTGKTVFREH